MGVPGQPDVEGGSAVRFGRFPESQGVSWFGGFRGMALMLFLALGLVLLCTSSGWSAAGALQEDGKAGLTLAEGASPASSITLSEGYVWRALNRLRMALRANDMTCEFILWFNGITDRTFCITYSLHALLECDQFESWTRITDIDQRLELYPGTQVVLEVGTNVGSDLEVWLPRFPSAKFFSVEPIPDLFRRTRQRFHDTARVKLLNFGLSDVDGNASMAFEGAAGEASSAFAAVPAAAPASFGSGGSGRRGGQVIQLRDASAVLREIADEVGRPPDVVSMNCEGCEYAVLERLLSTDWVAQVAFLQVSWHKTAGVPDRKARHCEIEHRLHETHDLVWFDFSFGWQGWAKRQSFEMRDDRRVLATEGEHVSVPSSTVA